MAPNPESNDIVEATASNSNPPHAGLNGQPNLPGWARVTLAVVTALSSAVLGGYTAYTKVNDAHQETFVKQQKELADARAKVVEAEIKIEEGKKHTQNMVNAVIVSKDDMQVYQETAKHSTDIGKDQRELKSEDLAADGTLVIQHFFADGCVQIIRRTRGKPPDTKWMYGPNVTFTPSDAPKPRIDNASNPPSLPMALPSKDLPMSNQIQTQAELSIADAGISNAVREAIYGLDAPAKLKSVGFQGRCWDPHPGTFTYTNQQINQCLIQVNRFFPDGCMHFQYFNPCNGSWDVWPNGAPKVTWTRCVH